MEMLERDERPSVTDEARERFTCLIGVEMRWILEELGTAGEHASHVIERLQRREYLKKVLFTVGVRGLNERALLDGGQSLLRLSGRGKHRRASVGLHLSGVHLRIEEILLHALSENQRCTDRHATVGKL